MALDLLHSVRTRSWNRVHHSLFPLQFNKPWPSASIHTSGDLPKRFDGFLLNSIRKRLCASRLRNCGIPSFALRRRNKQEVTTLPAFYVHSHELCLRSVLQFTSQSHFYQAALTKDSTNQASRRLACCNSHTYLRIMFIVSFLSFPWNGNVPVSISN